jgi:general secretion pathway protein D
MNQFSGRLALVICLLTALVLQAESAASLYKKGKDAEAAQMYEAAYELYKQAYDKDPKDLRFRVAFERTRFYAAAAKVHRGQLFRDGGRFEDALAQFEAAAAIDPSMDIAQQEIRLTRRMMEELKQQPPAQDEVQSQGPLSSRLQRALGPVELQAISDQPITLKMTEDSRILYEVIGKYAGINVLFDPDFAAHRIHVELNGVSLRDALQIVAFESKTFWRPVTRNTIFVAQDNPAKRRELEQSVIKTFYLSNVSQPAELNDIAAALRSLLQIERVQLMVSKNAIAVRGTPDQIALAEKLIDDFDKAEPEVVVDVAIMQVNRDRSRTLGITPPPLAKIGLTGAQDPASTSNNSGSSNPPSSGGLTFNSFKHLGSQSYSVAMSPATLNFLFGDSDSRIIQSPQVRSVNGAKATLKIGDRVPIASGSFANPLSGSGSSFNPVVQTQFSYQDVGVRIEITPTVHANREINLKVSMEISSITGKRAIGDIDQPTIGQRTIENEIRLSEGEINIMGGIFEDSEIKSWSGLPGLGRIPLFRHLFATETKDHNVNEILFVLIPHIVRRQEITPLNTESIDAGTKDTIELRESPTQAPPPAQPPTPPQPAQQHQ